MTKGRNVSLNLNHLDGVGTHRDSQLLGPQPARLRRGLACGAERRLRRRRAHDGRPRRGGCGGRLNRGGRGGGDAGERRGIQRSFEEVGGSRGAAASDWARRVPLCGGRLARQQLLVQQRRSGGSTRTSTQTNENKPSNQ